MPVSPTRTHANPRSAEQDAKLGAISARSSVARIGANRVDIREIALEVMAEMRVSQKAMAINADCPQSDLSNALQGKQRLDAQWLLDQDAAVVDRITSKVRARMGLTETSLKEVKAARIAELIRLILEIA